MRRRTTLHHVENKKSTQEIFGDEEHSLQGKHDKTHAVC
jgi:glutamate decarboxylase